MIEAFSFPVANNIPDAGSDDATRESDEEQGFQNAMLPVFLIELMVAYQIANQRSQNDDDAIPTDREPFAQRLIGLEVLRIDPMEPGAINRKTTSKRIRKERSHPFAKEQKGENR